MKKLIEIEGIGASYAEKLQGAGIVSVEDLLEKGSSPKGRKEIAKKAGVSNKLLLRWVNMDDLFCKKMWVKNTPIY